MARLTLRGEKGEGVAELASFNRKTPGMGHLTKFGLSRTKVVRNREHILTFFVGFLCKEDSPRVLGLSWGSFDQAGGRARGPSYVVFMPFLGFECLNVCFLSFLTHGGGFNG